MHATTANQCHSKSVGPTIYVAIAFCPLPVTQTECLIAEVYYKSRLGMNPGGLFLHVPDSLSHTWRRRVSIFSVGTDAGVGTPFPLSLCALTTPK